jgi:hypothetical protein
MMEYINVNGTMHIDIAARPMSTLIEIKIVTIARAISNPVNRFILDYLYKYTILNPNTKIKNCKNYH